MQIFVLIDVHFYNNDHDTTRHDMTVIFVSTLRSIKSFVQLMHTNCYKILNS